MHSPPDANNAQRQSYDLWFRERVQRSLDDKRPGISHNQVISEIDELLKEIDAQYQKYI